MSLATLQLPDKLEPTLASYHPWIYRNHLPKHTLAHGDWVRVQAGKRVAYGLYDEESAIAVRLFSRQTVPDRNWIAARVHEALALRERAIDPQQTTAYRLLFGEGDGLPGIVVDRYERYAVLSCYADSVRQLVPEVVKALSKQLKLRGIVQRNEAELTPLYGERPPPELTVREHGLQLLANLYQGQKTGLFLDHRENRQALSRYSQGCQVLNVFSYTGAFSLYALRGGAAHTTQVEISEEANADAQRNLALNGFAPDQHAFITGDAFETLQAFVKAGRQFDLVILDPPSLAKNKKRRFAALRAYHKLNTLALRCLTPGGLLASASCTSQVSPEAFKQMLGEAATDANARLQIIHEAGHAPDHPVPAHFPEGRYLKFVMARALPEC